MVVVCGEPKMRSMYVFGENFRYDPINRILSFLFCWKDLGTNFVTKETRGASERKPPLEVVFRKKSSGSNV